MRLFAQFSLRNSPQARRRVLTASTILALAATLLPATAATAQLGQSFSVLSLGDSITQGYGTCQIFANCPQNNWSTGNNPRVNSFSSRLQTTHPTSTITTANYARSGNLIAQIPSQVDAAKAAGVHPTIVTLLIGANDLCGPSITPASDGYTMTPASTFRAHTQETLSRIHTAWPSATIVVSSVPNIASLWSVARKTIGQLIWSGANLCRTTRGVSATGERLSDVASATSAAAASARTLHYDDALQTACTKAGPLCDWDGGALTSTPVTSAILSSTDFFHPGIVGQAKIAEVEWKASRFAAANS
ncbi:SGNH/GDSL hydrolase family protein [Rathayibacter toxicus]|uniref:SGNH/GDSL hydrolase family protein n=1 Tax=Rathayibacter toxicus TaxID=145458 RepID=A0A0C5B974_9MICO|nr:SGNH/GDSL hydrolase family protein [Rathayibacter toxicus]AJM77388.1 hypothetical protein TI83_04360 [Rathayibacter toxicus]ALS56719.1 hypothetical protein APU90_02115 [Rathayibacter toxicus]KKM45841.1 hypothetical protein VT73_05510 [Rathayibacter toxicus]PPG22288.1 SGNH/GDSL hydrolase family protein [Rathayibacter toxicus]PPG47123.1 SGNH/GDSL hydrolase family protein [Rathayibacter toxicus]